MAKSFHVFFQKKSPFSAFGVIQDTRVGVQDRIHGPRHPGEHVELETWNHQNQWNQLVRLVQLVQLVQLVRFGRVGQMGQMGSQLFSGKDNGAFDFSWCAYIIFNKV